MNDKILLIMLFLFIDVFYLTAPTEKDIAKCVAVTNYTAERCEWEMTR